VAQLLLAGLPALAPAVAAPCARTHPTDEHSRFIDQLVTFLAINACSSGGLVASSV
jgi:hypothetical protein